MNSSKEVDISWGDVRIVVEYKYVDRAVFANRFIVSKIYWNVEEVPEYFTDKSYSGDVDIDDVVADAVDEIRG